MTGTTTASPELLTPATARRWTPAVFGVVPEGGRRRRPGDVARIAVAALIVVVTAFGADELTSLEQRLFDLLTNLPDWVRSGAEVGYRAGAIGTVVVVLLAFVLTRRFRLVSMLSLAGALAWLAGIGLRASVDAATVRTAGGLEVDGSAPEYPVVVLAAATTVLLVGAPYLLRPARRLVFAVLAVAAASAVLAVVGLPDDVLGGWALGWGVAALVHLAVGTPAATPSMGEVDDALRGLGVAVTGLRLAPAQVWGETRFTAGAPDGGAVSIEVIGRDAADARLLAKVSLLVLREPDGLPLPDAEPERVTDSVLDDAWQNLARLHEAGLAHGMMQAANVVLLPDGTTALVDFAHASSGAPVERRLVDAVELLATTAALVGEEHALAAAIRALGREGLANVLPLLEPAALSAETRRELPERKVLLTRLREQGAALTGGEVATLAQLRRVSPGDLLIAAGTILGVYLLIGQLAGVDFATVFENAEWGWVGIAFLISPLPQFTGAIAMMGSVSAPLRYGAVVGEQFANNFTGLIGGTVATTALVIRFFQKQGLKVAVAASSGVLNSVAGLVVQAVLVIVGLGFTGSEFTASSTGGKDLAGLAVVLIVVAGVALGAMLVVPQLRRWARGVVQPQWAAARTNLRDVLTAPRQAVMLFGGNLGSQVLYGLVLGASLHAYGGSLPLLQLIVINSLASVVGGMAPVPGGMGVVEAGLIGGLTAAGIPQSEAVAATFTHRMFTAYLPPIWGWFALQWLRRQDYV